MQDRPSHTLPSFDAYVDKVFHLREALSSLRDARQHPDIPPAAVFRALFYGFVFRLRSFKELEADLAQPQLQQHLGASRPFRDDTLRYSLASFATEPLEQMLVTVNRQLKRNKALDPGRVQGPLVAALDGIEVLSSFSRCCSDCLQRRVNCTAADGQPVERIQYYHRAVGCQMVSSPVKAFLGLEWVAPGEGEDKAALRLLARLPDLYGQPLLRHLVAGFPLCPGPGPESGPGSWLGFGHHAETRKPRPIPGCLRTLLDPRSR